MMKYKILLKQLETGFTRVRFVNWSDEQHRYYLENLNKPLNGFVICSIEPVTEIEE